MNPKIAFDLKCSHGKPLVCGLDEAGRGCLAGPVVAASVVFDYRKNFPFFVDDSKRLKPKERKRLFQEIIYFCEDWAVGVVGWKSIDRMNIRNAAILAIERAYSFLKIKPDIILVDGNMPLDFSVRTLNIISGDSKSFAVGAASIIAKVVRDKLMERYHRLYPVYNFLSNKGYPTPEHKKALLFYGASPIHRRTFKGVGK